MFGRKKKFRKFRTFQRARSESTERSGMNNEKSRGAELRREQLSGGVPPREPGTSLWRINKARSSALVVALRAFRDRLSEVPPFRPFTQSRTTTIFRWLSRCPRLN